MVTFYCGLEQQALSGCTPPERQYAFALPNTTDVYASHASVPGAVLIFAEPFRRAMYVYPHCTESIESLDLRYYCCRVSSDSRCPLASALIGSTVKHLAGMARCVSTLVQARMPLQSLTSTTKC